jgi:Trp operon repressor
MAYNRNRNQPDTMREVATLLRDLLIVELAKAGVPQREIRAAVGGDLNRVTRFARLLKKRKGGDTE